MAAHSEHYPTWIENPKTKERVIVKTPLDHHRKLLAWKLPGLTPVPEVPAANPTPGPVNEPGYPTWIEDEKTHRRVIVRSKADHDAQLAAWDADTAPSTTRGVTPAKPPVKPAVPAKPATRTTASKTGEARQPPTKEELMKQGHDEATAQKIADEEVRKFNAGESPYNTEK